MDWAKFIQDNAQSLFTLGGVFLGSLITFLINYFNNRFQAKERDKDRKEQRKEAKILAKEKWIERDVLVLMDSIDNYVKLLSDYISMEEKYNETKEKSKSDSPLKDETNLERLASKISDMGSQFEKEFDTHIKIVYSFNRDVNSTLPNAGDLLEASSELSKAHANLVNFFNNLDIANLSDEEKEKLKIEKYMNTLGKAGFFHGLIRDALISIRDIE